MGDGLTDKQKEVYDFIRDHTRVNRIPPSVREVMKNFGWSSPQSAFQHMNALERKRFLEVKHGRFWPVEPTEETTVGVFRAQPIAGVKTVPLPVTSFLRNEDKYRLDILAARFLAERVPKYEGRGQVPLEDAVRDLGYRIEARYFEERISGQLVLEKRIILLNARHVPQRRRFTVGHEVGHITLHVAELARGGPVVSCDGLGRREMEANYFAASLLLPTQAVTRFLGEACSGPELHRIFGDRPREEWLVKRVASHFNVSPEAASRRLKDLRYVSHIAPKAGKVL
jgi:hypothetical protein